MSLIRKLMLLAAVGCSCAPLHAGEGKSGNNKWIGGSSGDFDNPANWEKGVPDYDETAIFDSNDPITVNVPEGVWPVWGFTVGNMYAAPDKPTTNAVTLVGSGKLIASQQANIYTNRWLVLAGADVSFNYLWTRGPNRIDVTNGSKLRFENDQGADLDRALSINANGKLCVSGGDIRIHELTLGDDSEFSMDAGRVEVFRVDKGITVGARVTTHFTGGTFINGNSLSFPSVEGKVRDLGGTLVLTNGTLTLEGTISRPVLSTFVGRGQVSAKQLTVDAKYLNVCTYQDLDVARLNLGSKLYAGASDYLNRLCLWNGATLGFFRDTTSERSMTVEAVGDLTVDTADCFDATKAPHAVNFGTAAISSKGAADLTVKGGGSFVACVKDRHQRWRDLTVGANTTFGVADGATYAVGGYRPQINAQILSLAAGATLNVTAYTGPVDTRKIGMIDATAKIVPSVPTKVPAGMPVPILTTDDLTADLSTITVDTAALAGTDWTVKRAPGVIYLQDATPDPAKTYDWEWTGENGGNWNDAGNWNGGVVPKWDYNKGVVFSGTKQTEITNDFGRLQVKVKQLKFASGGPFRLSGSELTPDGSGSGGWTGSSIESECSLPVIIDCDLNHGAFASSGLGITAYSNSYIRINGNVSVYDNLSIAGDIRFGGKVSCSRFTPVQNRGWDHLANRGTEGRNTQMTLLPGARFEAKNVSQDISCPNAFDLDVEAGATYLISGGTSYCWSNYPHDYFVNGTFDCRIPLGGATTMDISGTGTVYLASTTSTSADCDIRLGGGIRVIPAGWQTVTDSTKPGKRIRPVVMTTATFGATNDWTYGVASGVTPTTTSAQRALNLMRPLSTVTIDTQDPTTGAGHTVTFADPIVGYGKLVKKGAGTVVLASEANAVTGGVSVVDGTLAWTEPQVFTKLSAESGSTLAFGSKGGAPVMATVKGDLDLTDVNLLPYDAAAQAALETGYAPILRVEGALTGLPAAGKYRYRLRNGAVEAKVAAGMTLIVR